MQTDKKTTKIPVAKRVPDFQKLHDKWSSDLQHKKQTIKKQVTKPKEFNFVSRKRKENVEPNKQPPVEFKSEPQSLKNILSGKGIIETGQRKSTGSVLRDPGLWQKLNIQPEPELYPPRKSLGMMLKPKNTDDELRRKSILGPPKRLNSRSVTINEMNYQEKDKEKQEPEYEPMMKLERRMSEFFAAKYKTQQPKMKQEQQNNQQNNNLRITERLGLAVMELKTPGKLHKKEKDDSEQHEDFLLQLANKLKKRVETTDSVVKKQPLPSVLYSKPTCKTNESEEKVYIEPKPTVKKEETFTKPSIMKKENQFFNVDIIPPPPPLSVKKPELLIPHPIKKTNTIVSPSNVFIPSPPPPLNTFNSIPKPASKRKSPKQIIQDECDNLTLDFGSFILTPAQNKSIYQLKKNNNQLFSDCSPDLLSPFIPKAIKTSPRPPQGHFYKAASPSAIPMPSPPPPLIPKTPLKKTIDDISSPGTDDKMKILREIKLLNQEEEALLRTLNQEEKNSNKKLVPFDYWINDHE